MNLAGRLQNLRACLPKDGAALVLSGVNRFYLTGFSSSNGTVVVTHDRAFLLTDFRYIEAARETAREYEVLLQKEKVQLPTLLEECGVKTVLVESRHMTVQQRRTLDTTLVGFSIDDTDTLSDRLIDMRMVKDAEELARMQKAQQITDAGFSYILGHLREGVTERAIAAQLLHWLCEHGASGPSFDFIVASGVNSSRPHAAVTDKPLEAGDFITMDFGVVYQGYCSDMTRTVALGHCTDEMERVYQTVQQAQQAAFREIKAGVNPFDVDSTARQLIDRAGYEGCFGHSLGHSLGIEVHEAPSMSPVRGERVFTPGMVTSVEPGIYLEGRFGVRIEDVVSVSDTGYQNLTGSDSRLLILK